MKLRIAAVLLLLIPAASAQESCDNPEDPCPWVVLVDSAGFGQTSWTYTADEWYLLTIYNLEDKERTITIPEYQVSLTIAADSEGSQLLFLDKVGNFTVKDSATGKTGTLTVIDDDFVAATQTTTKGAGLPLVFAVAALLVAARRR